MNRSGVVKIRLSQVVNFRLLFRRITEEAKDFIINKGYDPLYGVRDLRRAVEKLIQIPLSNLILSNKLKGQSSWAIDCKNDNVVIMTE